MLDITPPIKLWGFGNWIFSFSPWWLNPLGTYTIGGLFGLSKNSMYFVFIFSYLWNPSLKKLFGFIFVFNFHFNIQKNNIWIQILNTIFWCFYFLENEYSDILVKKSNLLVLLSLTCHIKKHILSLYLLVVVIKKKWRRRQSRKWYQTKINK